MSVAHCTCAATHADIDPSELVERLDDVLSRGRLGVEPITVPVETPELQPVPA